MVRHPAGNSRPRGVASLSRACMAVHMSTTTRQEDTMNTTAAAKAAEAAAAKAARGGTAAWYMSLGAEVRVVPVELRA